MARMVIIGCRGTHARARDTVFTEANARHYSLLGERSVVIVDVQFVRLRVIAYENVRPAVIVCVENSDSQTLRRRIVEAGFFGDIGKSPIAIIVPEAQRRAMISLWRAIGFGAAVKSAVDVGFGRPLYVVCNQQVQASVAVVIQPGRTRAEFIVAPESRLLGDVGKRSVAIVAEKVALAEGGDENVVAAIVVVVADRHAH